MVRCMHVCTHVCHIVACVYKCIDVRVIYDAVRVIHVCRYVRIALYWVHESMYACNSCKVHVCM